MFQLFFFAALIAILLYLLLPRYLLSVYRRYRGDPYWIEIRPYKNHYSSNWVVLLFLIAALQLSEFEPQQLFYLLFIAFLLTLSWLDLKLRILPDQLLFGFAFLGIVYAYFVIDSSVLLRLAMVLLWIGCAKIVKVFAGMLGEAPWSCGLGAGDIKFILTLFCWFDGLLVLYLVAIACFIALFAILATCVLLQKTLTNIAFGPYLSVAAYIVWWFG